MRRELFALIAFLLLTTGTVHAGLVTNVNQSAAFVRMPARNATTDVDGVYYNPAGLTSLGDGWHFSVNNQFAFRNREVESDYSYLNGAPSATFPADANDVFFPGLYTVYKINKSAFSFGFNPILGIGGGDYTRGLPALEVIMSDLVPALQPAYDVTGYTVDMSLEETSSGFGYQFGVSHEIDPSISVFAGGRLVTVERTYRGAVKDIAINPINGTTRSYRRADEFASENAAAFTSASQSYSTAADKMQALISAGAGSYTIAQVQTAGFITSAERATLEAALRDLDLTSAEIAALRITEAKSFFQGASTHYATNATVMNGIQALASDRDLEVTQTGTGFAPILGVNVTPAPGWNVGIKYEFATKLELENDTRIDEFGTFPNREKFRNDLPAMLSVGVSYAGNSPLVMFSGLNYYFDRSANYGFVDIVGNPVENSDIIDANYFELAAGLEYTLNRRLLLSAGYMFGNTGVTEAYQSLMAFSLDSHTLGFGGEYMIAPNVALNAGCAFIIYREDDRRYSYSRIVPAVLPYGSDPIAIEPVTITDKYSRSDVILALGVDFIIGK